MVHEMLDSKEAALVRMTQGEPDLEPCRPSTGRLGGQADPAWLLSRVPPRRRSEGQGRASPLDARGRGRRSRCMSHSLLAFRLPL